MRLLALSYGVLAVHQHSMASSRGYIRNALAQLIESGRLTREDRIAYLGGAFGEGHGTSFLEINRVGEIMDNYNYFNLPNLEETDLCSKK